MRFTHRIATLDDLCELYALMRRAIELLQSGYPAFARQGVDRVVMELCEDAARAAGFARIEMMATRAGEPLYRACGYAPIERIRSAPIDGVTVPLIRMGKALS